MSTPSTFRIAEVCLIVILYWVHYCSLNL